MSAAIPAFKSAIYAGSVMHRRMRPRRHRLRYSIFSLLVDLDELDALDRRLKLFSRNKFNLFSFRDDDYGFETGKPLKEQIEGFMREAGVEPDGGPVRLLTIPRILGYAFNPLNVFFCYARTGGALLAIVCEVNNTFGQRHAYVLRPEGAARERRRDALRLRQEILCLTIHGNGPDIRFQDRSTGGGGNDRHSRIR